VLRGQFIKYPLWGLGDVLGTAIAALVLSAFAGYLLLAFRIDAMHSWALLVTLATPWVAFVGYPYLAAKYKGNGFRIDIGLTITQEQLRLAMVAGVISLAVAAAAGLISEKIFGPISATAFTAGTKETGVAGAVFALLVMSVGPLVEEIAFRGLLLTSLLKREMTPILANLIAAAVFALCHFEPKRIIILFAVGLVFGEVRRRTGSTIACAVTHMINNAPGAIFLLLAAFH